MCRASLNFGVGLIAAALMLVASPLFGYGLTFSLDERQSMVVVRCLSAHDSPDKRLREFAYWHFPDDREPPIRFVDPGVAETEFGDRAMSPSGQVTSHLMGWRIAP